MSEVLLTPPTLGRSTVYDVLSILSVFLRLCVYTVRPTVAQWKK